MSNKSIKYKSIRKVSSGRSENIEDAIAIEEPIGIKVSFEKEGIAHKHDISITMRTPGHDKDLAIGFLFTEGIINSYAQILDVVLLENEIEIKLVSDINIDLKSLDRHFYTTSSCGVCGKSSIDALRTQSTFDSENKDFKIDEKILFDLIPQLDKHQNIFNSTGGLHAATLFDKTGKFLGVREDVGRHNALDKLIGSALAQSNLPLDQHILLLSGRASFELIQKAYMAGVKIVVAVGAPSSLAIELAEEKGISLIGFLSGDRYNVYCGLR